MGPRTGYIVSYVLSSGLSNSGVLMSTSKCCHKKNHTVVLGLMYVLHDVCIT
jgi:hypothetical protein